MQPRPGFLARLTDDAPAGDLAAWLAEFARAAREPRRARPLGDAARAARRASASCSLPLPRPLREALERAGHRAALHAPGAGDRGAARRARHRGRDRHRERQEPVLPPAGARAAARRARGHGALPVPDQGARAGPAQGPDAARRRASRAAARAARRASTTATRSRPRAASCATQAQPDPLEPRHAAPGHPAAARRAGRASCAACASSWSTRCTPTAASSARTWRTCCAGSSGSCAHYGGEFRYVLCSATIRNPGELARGADRPRGAAWSTTTARRAARSTSCSGTRRSRDETRVERRSSNGEGCALFAGLIERGAQAIAFTKSRVAAELVYRYARERLERDERRARRAGIRPYRGGYLPEERRKIEQALFSGELRGVVSTNALELGVDIGGLDAVVMIGAPPTLASAWQQAGRAGRNGDAGAGGAGRLQRDRGPVPDAPPRLLLRPLARGGGASIRTTPTSWRSSWRAPPTSCRSAADDARRSARRRRACSRRSRRRARRARSTAAPTGRRPSSRPPRSTCAPSPTTPTRSWTSTRGQRGDRHGGRDQRARAGLPRGDLPARGRDAASCASWTWSRRWPSSSRARSTTTRSRCSTRTSACAASCSSATGAASACGSARSPTRGRRSR